MCSEKRGKIIIFVFHFIPGLNVYSMLKHETLVLTMAAVEKLEEKLLAAMHSKEAYTKFNAGTYTNL